MSPQREMDRFSSDRLEMWGRTLSERFDEQRDTIEKLRDEVQDLKGKVIQIETKMAFVAGLFGLAGSLVGIVLNYLLGKRVP